jgi:hypothetical protein
VGTSGILIATWLLVGVVVGAYVLFVVWRFRADKRKKAAQAAADAPMKTALRSPDLDGTATPSSPAESSPASDRPLVAAAPTAPVDPVGPPAARIATQPRLTIVQALAGINLPYDLVPLTTMAPRRGVDERVAFWTDTAPAEVVGPAFADELERLGYEVSSRDDTTLAGVRDDVHLVVVLHPDALLATINDQAAFPSVPERAVVIEAWISD